MGLRTQPIAPDAGFEEINPEEYLSRVAETTPVSLQRSAEAAVALSTLDTAVFSIARIKRMHDLEQEAGEKIEPGKLNEMYPEVSHRVPFTEPMTKRVADEIADRQRTRMQFESAMASGPGGFWGEGTRFAAGMIPHMFDPIEMASGFAAEGVLAKIAGRAAMAGKVSYRLASSPAGQFVKTAAEGIAGNLAVEPLVLFAAQQDQTDYDALDAMVNITGGAIGFAGARYAGSHALEFVRRQSPRLFEHLRNTAIGQWVSGRMVNVEPVLHAHVDELADVAHVGAPHERIFREAAGAPYEYRALPPERVNDRPLFAASISRTDDIREAKLRILEEDFGDGVYVTDNPRVAHANAAQELEAADGSVFEFKPDDLRYVDLQTPAKPELVAAIREVLPELAEKVASKTGREALETVREGVGRGDYPANALGRIQEALRGQGFDAYRWEGGDFLGSKNTPHNAMLVFNPEKVQAPVRSLPADRTLKPQLDEGALRREAERSQSQEAQVGYDAEAVKQHQAARQSPAPADPKHAEVALEADSVVEQLDSLKAQELLSDTSAAELEVLKQAKQDEETLNRLMTQAFHCVSK
jgi:hypothetical protein